MIWVIQGKNECYTGSVKGVAESEIKLKLRKRGASFVEVVN